MVKKSKRELPEINNCNSFISLNQTLKRLKKSPFYRGAKLWLKLLPNIRQMEDKGEFKSATKRYFGL